MKIPFKKLSISKFIQLSKLCIQNPRLMLITYWVSKKTMVICQRKFGSAHFGNGKENAYRHALWCMLLQYNTEKYDTHWAAFFSNLYEGLFRNDEVNSKMDLHNNSVSLNDYTIQNPHSYFKIFRMLDTLSDKAIALTEEEMKSGDSILKENLVYIIPPTSEIK